MAVALSTLKWNLGGRGILAAMTAVDLEYGQDAVNFFDKEDKVRMAQARRKKSEDFLRKRKQRKAEKTKRIAALRKKQGVKPDYEPGGY
jgi:predicted ArsR family transcriptional regulator